MVQDNIADMLTRMRNALQMRYQTVVVNGTKMTLGIAEILKKEGFITDYNYEKNITGDKLTITLNCSVVYLLFILFKVSSHPLCNDK